MSESNQHLTLQPISLDEANRFVMRYHRHHKGTQGWKFGVAVSKDGIIVGVAIAGRPVARQFDDGWTVEITRCCTEGTKNATSKLYGALCRASFALGYKRVVTYTLKSESGASLKASGYRCLGVAGGGSWHTPNLGRPRVDKHPIEPKLLWEKCPDVRKET